MIQLDLSDHRPLYEQIKEKLKHLIISGVIKEHEKIPSVRELSAILTINPNTIQHAYKELEAEGFIYSQKAKGNFVAPRSHTASVIDIDEVLKEVRKLAQNAAFAGIDKECLIREIEKCYGKL